MKSLLVSAVFVALCAAPLAAQQSDIVERARLLAEARQLGNAGQISGARRITDSLSKPAASDADDFADVLFARATLAPSVLDASLDYEKIIAEAPRSTAARASLLRLAQRALISLDGVKALEYLQRILRDFPDDASVAEAQYWRARALVDAHDITAACLANREALAHAEAARSPLLTAIRAQGLLSCGEATPLQPVAQPVAPAPKPNPPASNSTVPASMSKATPKADESPRRHYAVQVAAYARRADADAMADRLNRKGLNAHVDGSEKPFRVRLGRYDNYAEAAKALRELKAKNISGFVSETDQ